jgi:multidrug resistance efflux pump
MNKEGVKNMKKNLWKVLIPIFLASTLLLSACGLIQPTAEATALPPVTSNGNISAEGRVVPRTSVVLAFPSGGQIESIAVQKGADVKTGDVLVQLGNFEAALAATSAAQLEQTAAQQAVDKLERLADVARAQAQQQLAAAEKALILAQKAFDDLDTQSFRDDLDARAIDLQTAVDRQADAQKEFDKYKDLDPNNATRKNAQTVLDNAKADTQQAAYDHDLLQNQLDQASAALELAQASQSEAKRAFEARSNGPDTEEQALTQARLNAANAQLAAAEKALEHFSLTAPFDGRVLDDKNLFVGEWLSPYQPALVLADLSTWYVETKDLNETDVVNIEVGQKAEIRPDAMKNLTLNGTVEWIDETYSEKSGDVVYLVRIRLDDSDNRLRWGMTVQIDFIQK